jgi:hypothetical protein
MTKHQFKQTTSETEADSKLAVERFLDVVARAIAREHLRKYREAKVSSANEKKQKNEPTG